MGEPVSQEVNGKTADTRSYNAEVSAGVSGRRMLLGVSGVFLLWLLLTGSLDLQEVIAGLLVAVLVTLMSLSHLHLLDGIRLRPGLPWYVFRFILVFFRALIQANIDMARRVLSPSLPVCPGVVEVRTQLESPLGRLLLANAITLTPGTLSVDVHADTLIVHWVDISPGSDIDHATRAIVTRFERHLKELVT